MALVPPEYIDLLIPQAFLLEGEDKFIAERAFTEPLEHSLQAELLVSILPTFCYAGFRKVLLHCLVIFTAKGRQVFQYHSPGIQDKAIVSDIDDPG